MALHILILKRRIRGFRYKGAHPLFMGLISKNRKLFLGDNQFLTEFAQARRDIPQFAL